MASGDRIELLTANAFETAMSSVAKETSVQSCAAKIDNVDSDVAALAATINNINSVITADYQLDQTLQSVLADIYNNRIGATSNTGGTATAGTMMAKLNALITGVNSLLSNSNTSLHSTIFVPSGNLLKTAWNTPQVLSELTVLGCFVAKYSGCISVTYTISAYTSANANVGMAYVYKNLQGKTTATAIHPSMLPFVVTSNQSTNEYAAWEYITPPALTKTMYIPVKAGEIVYFALQPYGTTGATITCSNISVYGTAMSYF